MLASVPVPTTFSVESCLGFPKKEARLLLSLYIEKVTTGDCGDSAICIIEEVVLKVLLDKKKAVGC